MVRLAGAELALREGRYYEAESLAVLAARDLSDAPDRAARANFVAGRAAHVASREEQAEAIDPNRQRRPQDRPSWFGGQNSENFKLQSNWNRAMYRAVAALGPAMRWIRRSKSYSPTGRSEQRLGLGSRRPCSGSRRQTATQVCDGPNDQTSFRNVFGYTLAATAHFDEALELVAEQLEDAERYRLEFVVPYALINKPLSAAGGTTTSSAEEFLDEADERALKAGDETALNTAGASADAAVCCPGCVRSCAVPTARAQWRHDAFLSEPN